jgi:hypothetical protein
MKIKANWWFQLFALLTLSACSNDVEESAGLIDSNSEHVEIIRRDLLAIISVQDSSCLAVNDYTKQSDLDYLATCSSGDEFHIHVSPEGVVEVELVSSAEAFPGAQ